jgi:hypothetical protein
MERGSVRYFTSCQKAYVSYIVNHSCVSWVATEVYQVAIQGVGLVWPKRYMFDERRTEAKVIGSGYKNL